MLGLALTLGSLTVAREQPASLSVDGPTTPAARLYGAPAPWAFVVTDGNESPAASRAVYCQLSFNCELPRGYMNGPAVGQPFLWDWVFWSGLSLACLTVLGLAAWTARWLRSNLGHWRRGT